MGTYKDMEKEQCIIPVFPMPSCPLTPFPKPNTSPSDVRAKVCSYPQNTCDRRTANQVLVHVYMHMDTNIQDSRFRDLFDHTHSALVCPSLSLSLVGGPPWEPEGGSGRAGTKMQLARWFTFHARSRRLTIKHASLPTPCSSFDTDSAGLQYSLTTGIFFQNTVQTQVAPAVPS